ncbi:MULTISPECIES: GH25 family lysozyme [unclassified Bacillus (in: firmicutes)]|uniref:GH25 family lysozyme n=1 Tax=unclassified Bacillus (in: firmicutes) TaxID=185979 RepID=UPI001C9A2DFA|nr:MULTISPECIES: GH25 family lysozyme [unclassified Bacillus (in: firmicutes)]MBY7125958.1 N-acetylmuramoyl-L-alanine amidase [Bacillus sp. 16GRE42]MCR6850017.1 N-acetylmuramoyl-L-alanine amidase [Bacillus sp. IBL03825]HDR7785212.1 N-acetylmuramoyl-L-alanine amidase [Bacillus wiedmannii]
MKKIADLSHHNNSINWAAASKELDLAIIRVQYGSRTIDKRYKEYVQGCKDYGVPFGHYAYGCYVSIQDAIVEANDFMARADKEAKFLVLDVEDDTLASCGAANLAKASQAFIDTCRAAGWKVGLYVSHHMYTSYGLNTVNADFLWIPRYGNKPAYSCDLWQYTETGSLAGVTGNVDLNYLNSEKSLEWFTGKGGVVGTPQPEGIGFAKSIYWEGYGINYYDGPHGNYLGDFTTAAEVLYWDAYWGEDNDVWLDLGRGRWVKAEHYYWRPFKAISKFPEGYEVSYCDGINGAYKGSINSKEPLTVFFRKEGWIDIGGNRWAPEKHFDIIDIR